MTHLSSPEELKPATWSIPYIDQPVSFWESIAQNEGYHIEEVYFPLPGDLIGSGRPELPNEFLDSFLASAPLSKAALLNAVTLPGPVKTVAPDVIDYLRRLRDEFGVDRATVANPVLATEIREHLPEFELTASVLMNVAHPSEIVMLQGLFDVLVPGGRAMRNLKVLLELKDAFDGRIRLLVNEGCLGGCPWRHQHFHEMCTHVEEPESYCDDLLAREPWMRLTGAWVTPQFLDFFDEVADQFKLAGRVTLADPKKYEAVLKAYSSRESLLPCEIGGGPSSMIEPFDMPRDLYAYTLQCGQHCHQCSLCRDHYANSQSARESIQHQPELT